MGKYRIFVEKKADFRVEAEGLRNDFNNNLNLNIKELRLLNIYDCFNISEELVKKATEDVFKEIVTDISYENVDLEGKKYISVEFLPGQFDQRASSAKECIQLIDSSAKCNIKSGKLIIFDDSVTDEDVNRIKKYYINEIESREKDLNVLDDSEYVEIEEVKQIENFINKSVEELQAMRNEMGLAMSLEDLQHVQKYFVEEKRNPYETEIRMLDTYWSDHCRHTTFETELKNIVIEDSFLKESIENSLNEYLGMRKELNREHKEVTLMDLATICGRYLKAKNILTDLEVSEENNACSVYADIKVDGKVEKYLVMFKNETHNHPTEIEPFGGASTCVGGAIRDPLSGRSYVYQAMRITGSGNIFEKVEDTIPGKLPQKNISKQAAAGYSSYGNQIGLATTYVKEIYHDGYKAKRMEIGAVVGCAKVEDVRREKVVAGDIVIMLGGLTGRDGIGGATGSSKEHNEKSIEVCSSEVQKGNAPEERKIQHLFRRSEVTRLIKKSNDFGAGGVSVAIGELADSLLIDLNQVQTKYAGLNGTEIAISESQERMAVVVDAKDVEEFLKYCKEENILAYKVADVTDNNRLQMTYKGQMIVDIDRTFINTNGIRQHQDATIASVEYKDIFKTEVEGNNLKEKVLNNLNDINVLTQKGLVEIFDATIGNTTVLMPYGGKYQLTETQVSCQKVSVLHGYTDDCSIMSYGFDPYVSSYAPYIGSQYAVLDSIAKIVSCGGTYKNIHFSYQEYFEKLNKNEKSWGKPLAALLGTVYMQKGFGLASIGGKDSMSGTFKDLNVPPTLVSFAQGMGDANNIISPEFKNAGNGIYLLKLPHLKDLSVDIETAKKNFDLLEQLIKDKKVVSSYAVGFGGVAAALAKMSFGNKLGFDVKVDENELFDKMYGSFVVEATCELEGENLVKLGSVNDSKVVSINGVEIEIEELLGANFDRYNEIYKTHVENKFKEVKTVEVEKKVIKYPFGKKDKVNVFIPVFPGTNCDYDTKRAFEKEGANVVVQVFSNLTEQDILDSIALMAKNIDECDVLAFAGGFSSGDEPDGSGKFIANVINNQIVKESIERLLERKCLVLGICNGFQALIKSGLLPYGKLGVLTSDSPTLFRNDINRHISHITKTRVGSTNSPWLSSFEVGDIHEIAISHGEGKFVVNKEVAEELFNNGQVCFQYVDLDHNVTMEAPYNPNGSYYAIEGITSPDGLVLGKMGHSERYENNIYKNIPGNKFQNIFKNAVDYFTK